MAKGKNNGNRKEIRRLGESMSTGLLGTVPKSLQPVKKKRLVKQAERMMSQVYKPALNDLGNQEERLLAVSEKRKNDNQYYLDWLTQQSATLQSHAEAADARVAQAGQDVANQSAQDYQALRGRIVEEAGQHAETVSNPHQAQAFDISAESRQAAETIGNQRELSAQLTGSRAQETATQQASNFATMAAAEARRVADTWGGLKDIAEGREKVQLEKGAAKAQEIARLLDQEIAKAQARGALKVQSKQLTLQAREAKRNARISMAQLGLDEAQLAETIRSNKAGEGIDAATLAANIKDDQADNKLDAQQEANDAKADQKENQQEKKAASKQIIRVVNNAVGEISATPSIQQLLASNPQQAARKLIDAGYEPWAAQAAIDLTSSNSLSSATKKRLKQLGLLNNGPW